MERDYAEERGKGKTVGASEILNMKAARKKESSDENEVRVSFSASVYEICARLTVSETQRPEQAVQKPKDAPDESGGVSGTPDVEERPVQRIPVPEQQRIASRREDIRSFLAGGLTVLFIAMIVAIFASAIFGGEQWARVQEFVQIAFGTVAGLAGSAVGFYFGSQR